MTYKSRKSQKGFTLVELAIVLVIIGLIVSGVLVGQDLIKAAELRATVRQIQDFQVGVNTFIGKYGSIPGDTDSNKFGLCDGDGNASDGSPTTCNIVVADAATTGCDGETNLGDGDGLIEDSAGSLTVHNGEVSCFWANLTTPGKELVKGVYDGFSVVTASSTTATNDVPGTNMPLMRFGSRGWGVFTDGTDNFFVSGVIGEQATDDYDTADTFIPIDLFNIDDKIDDGVPSSGDVQAVDGDVDTPNTQDLSGTTATFATGASATTACVSTTPTPDEYQFTATTALCNLRVKMQTF